MKYIILLCLWCCLSIVTAEEKKNPVDIGLTFGMEGKVSTQLTNTLSTMEFVSLVIGSQYFDLKSTLSASSDGRFAPDIADFRNTQNFSNNYFLVDEAWARLKFPGLAFSLGRIKAEDAIQSPYSLFINSDAHSFNPSLASNSMIFLWDTPIFSYETRWIGLNNRSNFGSVSLTPPAWQWVWQGSVYVQNGTGFPDRGVNLKNFIFKIGDMRLGFQESATYTQRYFDAEYFAVPIPMYFTQYVNGTAGRPWTTSGNDNYMVGLFWDWKQPLFYLYSQVLIDDFSGYFLSKELFPNNPWKMAWSLGGTVKTEAGRFGFYHGGAVKYTFEPITTQLGQDLGSAYGYSYFPDSMYYNGGAETPLGIQDYQVGYKNGENNLAFMVTWDHKLVQKLNLAGSLEFVVSGSNSPANPWHDATGNEEVGTQLLNESVLEKRLIFSVQASYPIEMGPSFGWDFYIKMQVGGIFNKLELSDPVGRPGTDVASSGGWSAVDYYSKIFRPSANNQGVFNLQIGFRLNMDIGTELWKAVAPPILTETAPVGAGDSPK